MRSVNKKQKGTAFGIVAIVEFVINIIVIAILLVCSHYFRCFYGGLDRADLDIMKKRAASLRQPFVFDLL